MHTGSISEWCLSPFFPSPPEGEGAGEGQPQGSCRLAAHRRATCRLILAIGSDWLCALGMDGTTRIRRLETFLLFR